MFVRITCKNNIVIDKGIKTLTTVIACSAGIICISAIRAEATYPIHITGFAFSLEALKYSCRLIAATIANIMSTI